MTILKAVVGALVAGLGALATALVDNSVVPLEWVTVSLAAATALGAIFQTPNQPTEHSERRRELDRMGVVPPPPVEPSSQSSNVKVTSHRKPPQPEA
jgi:hypothetical protein